MDEHLVADMKLVFQPRQIPPAAVQPGGAVIKDELEDRLGPFRKVVHPLGDDPAEDRGRLVQFELGNSAARSAVFVTAGLIEEKILNRRDAELGEELHMPRADPAKGGDRAGKWRWRGGVRHTRSVGQGNCV